MVLKQFEVVEVFNTFKESTKAVPLWQKITTFTTIQQHFIWSVNNTYCCFEDISDSNHLDKKYSACCTIKKALFSPFSKLRNLCQRLHGINQTLKTIQLNYPPLGLNQTLDCNPNQILMRSDYTKTRLELKTRTRLQLG